MQRQLRFIEWCICIRLQERRGEAVLIQRNVHTCEDALVEAPVRLSVTDSGKHCECVCSGGR